ncbi:MAG TPA: hypothetical protein VGC76_05560 [Pyrinomonadaceae bacterium]|jgi:predicted nucleic-acid-binding Zn-ribbon protein
MDEYASCPKCRGAKAEKVSFTWWGGILGPKLFSHVRCLLCGATYNGKSGKDNTINILLYLLFVLAISFGAFFIVFALR